MAVSTDDALKEVFTSSLQCGRSAYARFQMLLVTASSKDPWSTTLYDPHSGASVWSFKGAELQGHPAGTSVLAGDCLLLSVADQPLLYHIGLQAQVELLRSFGGGDEDCREGRA